MAHYAQAEADGHGLELWILRLRGQERREALQQYADLVDGSLHLVLEVLKGWWLEAKRSRLLEKERAFVITNRVTSVRDDAPSPPSPSHWVSSFCMAKQWRYYNQDRINCGWIDSKFLQLDSGGQGRDTSTIQHPPPYSPT